MHVAVTEALVKDLIPALEVLAESLERKSAEFKDVVKSGRTHLMDATPSPWARVLRLRRNRALRH